MTSEGIRFWNRLDVRITVCGCIIVALAMLPLAVHHFLIAPAEHGSASRQQVEELGRAVAFLLEGGDSSQVWASLGALLPVALGSAGGLSHISLLDGRGRLVHSTDSAHGDRSVPSLAAAVCQGCHRAGQPPDTGSVAQYTGPNVHYIRTIGWTPRDHSDHTDSHAMRGHLWIELGGERMRVARTAALRVDLLLSSFIVVLAIAAFYVVVRHGLIQRLLALEAVALSPLDTPDLPVDRDRDELSRLGHSMRSMRASLEEMLERIEEQKSFLAHLLESLDDGILVIDGAGNVQLANRRLSAILDLPEDAMSVGRSWCDEVTWPSRLTTLREWMEASRESQVSRRQEVSIPAASRNMLHLECHSTLLWHPGERRPSVLLSIRDITDRKEAQEQLYRAEKLATVGQLAAGVAHEINNPLACILTCSSGLSRPGASDDAHRGEYIDIISSSARRCKAVTDKLLSYAARGAMETRDFDLGDLLKESTDLLQFDARRKRIHVSLQPTERLPRITGDRDLLLQVFVDLTLNGIQAVKRGGQVEVSWGRDKEFAWVTVADNGPGIPQALRDRVFDPFFTTKRVGEGTGLGLSVSLGIVRQHGGTLELMEAYRGRQGACFRVTLPLQSHLQKEPAVA